MQNYTLAITKNCIPYFKELRSLARSVTASILMQQLDYWFSKTHGEPFYKFKSPCENIFYQHGDSFIEELGFSADEFTTAFAKIGIVYKSKTEFESENDKFKGMFYCSYFDRKEGLTFYYRNHKLLDIELNKLFTVNRESPFTETGKPNLQKQALSVSSIYITETTTETTTDIKKINKKSPLADKKFLDTFYFYKMKIGALKQIPTEGKETQEMTKAYQSWNKVLKDYNAEQIQQSCKAYFKYIEITKITWDSGGRPVRGDFTTWLNNFQSFDSWNGLRTQEMQKPKYKVIEEKQQEALLKKRIQDRLQNNTEEDTSWDF